MKLCISLADEQKHKGKKSLTISANEWLVKQPWPGDI